MSGVYGRNAPEVPDSVKIEAEGWKALQRLGTDPEFAKAYKTKMIDEGGIYNKLVGQFAMDYDKEKATLLGDTAPIASSSQPTNNQQSTANSTLGRLNKSVLGDETGETFLG
jgi:hypothetical protein